MSKKSAEEIWYIKGHRFAIFKLEKEQDQFAVRVVNEGHADGGFWLEDPEKYFETMSGCRYAVLKFLQNLESKNDTNS